MIFHYIAEYLLNNGNHYLMGVYSDLGALIQRIHEVDHHRIYWRHEEDQSVGIDHAYGFYKPQPATGEIWDSEKHGGCSWRITGYKVNDYSHLEHPTYLYEVIG